MSAVISDCGRYRYTLEREWMTGRGTCLFVMLNPSTADARKDDPTIGRCIKFAQRWGFQKLTVGNLYAFRATDPKQMLATVNRTGPMNDPWLGLLAREADQIICAWGANAEPARAAEVVATLSAHRPVECLGTTADGSPKHPLARGRHRIPDDFEPIPFKAVTPSA